MIILREENLKEKLERISDDDVFATDSVGDIVNWLINKPKPYRIVYDRCRDIWIIGDANKNTHRTMTIDLVDSDYILDYIKPEQFDAWRNQYNMKYYTDSEVYNEVAWNIETDLYGIIFIPNNYDYYDYEDSGFYSISYPIETGQIYVRKAIYFSPDGVFSPLFNKLKMFGYLKKDKKSLDDILRWVQHKAFDSRTMLIKFIEISGDMEFPSDLVDEYIDKHEFDFYPDGMPHINSWLKTKWWEAKKLYPDDFAEATAYFKEEAEKQYSQERILKFLTDNPQLFV